MNMQREHAEVTVGHLLAIAFPMIISQASETIMLFLNRYFVSFLGAEYIPASMSGGLTQFVFTSLFAGTVGYVNALTAQYQGAGKPERAVRVVAQGFWLSLAFFPLLLALIPLVQHGFAWAGHDARLVALEVPYFRILM
jgi:multidrug resistance protein, MATE family